MIKLLDKNRDQILAANQRDLEAFKKDNHALYDRLAVNNDKINGMIKAVKEVRTQDDPVGKELSRVELKNGLEVINKTAPFGTIMIIYDLGQM